MIQRINFQATDGRYYGLRAYTKDDTGTSAILKAQEPGAYASLCEAVGLDAQHPEYVAFAEWQGGTFFITRIPMAAALHIAQRAASSLVPVVEPEVVAEDAAEVDPEVGLFIEQECGEA